MVGIILKLHESIFSNYRKQFKFIDLSHSILWELAFLLLIKFAVAFCRQLEYPPAWSMWLNALIRKMYDVFHVRIDMV